MDNMLRTLARSNYVIPIRVDSKSVGAQIGRLTKALSKSITLPVDLNIKVNGQKVAIEQSKTIERSIKAAETAQKNFDKTAKASIDRRVADAQRFEAALKKVSLNNAVRSAKEVSAALKVAESDAARLKAQLDANVARGLRGMRSEMGAGLAMQGRNPGAITAAQNKHNASIQQAVRFTSDFNQHLQRMQALIEGAANKSANLSGALSTTGRTVMTAAGAFALMGRGLSAIGTIGTGVTRVLLGLGRSIYNFARAYVLFPLLYRGFGALKEATIGYSVTLERARTSLTSMMNGSALAANGLLDKLESFAIRTQFSFDDLAALAPQLRVAKVATEDIIPTFTALGDAVTSAAKGKEGLKALVGDMISLSMRGKVTGQDLRNFAANGVNLVTYLSQAYSSILPKGTKEAELAMRQMITKGLIPADKAIKAFVAGVENDPLRAGQMAKQARTYEGAMSNIGDALKRVLGKEAFGDTFEWLTKKVNRFLEIVSSPALVQWGKDIAPRVLSAFKGVASFFGAVINYGTKAFSVLRVWIGGLLDAWPRVQKAGVQAFGFIGAAIRTGARVVGFLTAALHPLTPLFRLATQGAHDFWDVLRGVGSLVLSIGEGLNRVMIPAMWAISKPIVGVSQLITGVFDKIPKNLLSRIIGSDATSDLTTLVDGLKSATQFIADATTFDGNQKLWQGLQDAFNDGVNATEAGWERIKKTWQTSGFDSPDFKNLTKGIDAFAGVSADDFSRPNYGWGDTNKNNKNAAQAQQKALQELAKTYDQLSKSAEGSAKRQLDALKGVRDTLQEVLGSIQSELARFGVFNSSVFDQFASALQKIVDLGGKSDDIVAKALERMGKYGDLARNAREGAKAIGQSISGTQPTVATVGDFPVSTAMVAGKKAGASLIENLVREFNDKSPRKLGASCADVASKVLNAIGYNLKYSANARQLLNNAKKAGWAPVPLGTPGALHVQTGRGFGKISGAHTTIGIGNGKVAGSSGYKFQEYDITGAKGNPIALMPKKGALRIPSFLNNPMGVGNVAALQAGDNGPEAFKKSVQDLLQSLNISKLALPPEWGKPIKDAADQAHMFQAQMMLASENTQAMLRAVLGEKFAAFVKRLREGTYAADQLLTALQASDKLKGEIEQGTRDKRARGQENNPFYALRQEYTANGQTKGVSIFALAKREGQIREELTDNVARAMDKLRRAEDDHNATIRAGLPFIQGATKDLYGYARAVELAQRKIEYARSEGMVKLFQGDKRQFNIQLADFVKFDKQRFDFQKGNERELSFATAQRDLDRRLAQLQAEQSLVSNLSFSESQLTIELEKQGYYFGQLYSLRDSGHDDERSRQLAKQLTVQNALNTAIERAIAAQRDWNKSVQESKAATTLGAAMRGLYASMRGGPGLDRALFEKETRSGLQARFDSGEFDAPTNIITSSLRAMRGIISAPQIRRDPLELEKRVQQALQNFDDKSATDRVAQANARWTQMTNELLQKRAELERPLSELAKAQLDFKIAGKAQSAEELNLQGKILDTARQIDALATDAWQRQQAQVLKLASIFDPSKRADQQFRFDHPEWSEEQISAMLPIDQMNRKLLQGYERMQSLQDGIRGSWSSLFRDIAKGSFTFGSFLDSITNKLAEFAADTLSSAAFQGLEGFLSKLTGGLLRGNNTPLSVPFNPSSGGGIAAGLANSGRGLFNASSLVSSDPFAGAARSVTSGMARQTSATSNSENNHFNLQGAIINVASEQSLPSAIRSHVQQQTEQQGPRDSRRSLAKKAQIIIGNR